MSVTLTELVRISKTRFCWKELSLKMLLFINLCPTSRGPSIFPDKLGRLKERCVTRQNWNNTQVSNESSFETQKSSLEFRETSIFYICHSKGFWETIYFSSNITRTTRTYSESTKQLHLRGKFLSEKKGQRNVFICKFRKLSQYFCTKFIFWSINFELFIYLWRFVFTCVARDCVN